VQVSVEPDCVHCDGSAADAATAAGLVPAAGAASAGATQVRPPAVRAAAAMLDASSAETRRTCVDTT
jgi:hypothetical protein